MPQSTPDRLGAAFVAELQAFVDCILQDTAPPISGDESRHTVSVGIAATMSLHAGKPVNL
jgi:myo-inositol 2-dehydrogenase/D-chiro-inositol 1-dehydrogenase